MSLAHLQLSCAIPFNITLLLQYYSIYPVNIYLFRPQTAGPVPNAYRKLNMALYKMSPDLAGMIKDALSPSLEGHKEGRNTPSRKKSVLDIPGTKELDTIHERLQGK